MSVKIIGLDPSAQYQNQGLGGYCEAYGTWEIAQACKAKLEQSWGDRCEVVLSRTDKDSLKPYSDYLTREIKALNSAHCNIAVAIHSDAGGGRGVTCFKGGDISEKVGQALLDALDGKVGIPLRQDKPIYHYKGPTYLGIIRNTKMPTVLIECGFHDNREDIKVLGTAVGRKAIGEALATGIANYYGWRDDTMPTDNQADVSPWAQKSVDWAKAEGLMTPDIMDGKFHGQDNVTREQLAVVLHRYHCRYE